MARNIVESFLDTSVRLMDLGLGYLSLDRAASTLSTGRVLGSGVISRAFAMDFSISAIRSGSSSRYAIIESASVIPSKVTNALVGPTFASSYGLIQKKWFAEMQFRYLRIREDLFEDYYKDTSKISKYNMIAFLKANTAYEIKPSIKRSHVQVRIVVGGKEQKKMLRSAALLHELLPGSCLDIKDGLYHGEYSINYPEVYVKELLEMIV